MQILEAIDHLRKLQSSDDICDTVVGKAIHLAIQSLEKDIPRKVSIHNWMPARCPSCGKSLSEHVEDGYYHHLDHLLVCPNEKCRQRLTWE